MSGFTPAGFENTPDMHLTNQQVGEFSMLDDAALTFKIQQYGSVMLQDGVNPRALATAQRILTHLNFEQQYRSGVYDNAIERHRAEEAAAAEQALDEVPAALAARRLE